MLKETDHDYQNCLVGNFHDSDYNGSFDTWEEFKKDFSGFHSENHLTYDDTYHFVFRYDIHRQENENYRLELCVMLQRKGIYIHLNVRNIDEQLLNSEVKQWLQDRNDYIQSLWKDVSI
ncbi:hypothetical protein GCM10008931_44290 [Oceanobacillus oncorhynchi subsp. oncorhynchi]|uniref:hypothetical protein n=1 Tax=Oceanobacillus oncorhynchi TaxID=545501 RepID=UPI0031D53EEB